MIIPTNWKREFWFWKKKYALSQWRNIFGNFSACVRQISLRLYCTVWGVAFNATHLLSSKKFGNAGCGKKTFSFFDCEPSEYWLTHYRFLTNFLPQRKSLGENKLNCFLINTVAPFLFFVWRGKTVMKNHSLINHFTSLEQLPSEKKSNHHLTGKVA